MTTKSPKSKTVALPKKRTTKTPTLMTLVAFVLKEDTEQQFRRIQHLIVLYDRASSLRKKGEKRTSNTDILRAAVVLLHATLEDVLREIARMKLPDAMPSVLNEYPLLGTSSRKSVFGLGDLKRFEDKKVGELIKGSINEFLERETFNSSDDICHLFRRIGIDPAAFAAHYPVIQEMMKRRHHIVHRTDRRASFRKPMPNPGRAITRKMVVRWVQGTWAFIDQLLREF